MTRIKKNKVTESEDVGAEGTTSLRISKSLHKRLAEIAEEMPGLSATGTGVAFLEAMIQLSEAEPEARRVPKILLMIDAVRIKAPKMVSSGEQTETDKKVLGAITGESHKPSRQ